MTIFVAESFAELPSTTSPEIVTVFDSTVPAGRAGSVPTVREIVPLPLTPSDALEQVIVPFMPAAGVEQLQPAAVIEVNVVPDGSASVRATLAATLGPDAE